MSTSPDFRSPAFLRRHIRTINLIGGGLLIVIGLVMVSGLWTAWMSELQGVMSGIQLVL